MAAYHQDLHCFLEKRLSPGVNVLALQAKIIGSIPYETPSFDYLNVCRKLYHPLHFQFLVHFHNGLCTFVLFDLLVMFSVMLCNHYGYVCK